MKPVGLIERAIRNSSRRGDMVLDPFGGSGSTLIACEKTGRRAALVEIGAQVRGRDYPPLGALYTPGGVFGKRWTNLRSPGPGTIPESSLTCEDNHSRQATR